MCFGRKEKKKRPNSPAYNKNVPVHPSAAGVVVGSSPSPTQIAPSAAPPSLVPRTAPFSAAPSVPNKKADLGKAVVSPPRPSGPTKPLKSTATTPVGLPHPKKGVSAGIDVPTSLCSADPIDCAKTGKGKAVSRPPPPSSGKKTDAKTKAVSRPPPPPAKKTDKGKVVPPPRRPPPSGKKPFVKAKTLSPRFPSPFTKKEPLKAVPPLSRFPSMEKKNTVTKIVPPSMLSKPQKIEPFKPQPSPMGLPHPKKDVRIGIAVPTSIWAANDDDMYKPKQYDQQEQPKQAERPAAAYGAKLADDDMYNPKQYTEQQKAAAAGGGGRPTYEAAFADDGLYNPKQYSQKPQQQQQTGADDDDLYKPPQQYNQQQQQKMGRPKSYEDELDEDDLYNPKQYN